MNHTANDGVVAREDLIVEVGVRSEVSNLSFFVKGVNEHKIDPVLVHVACTWTFSSRQEPKMRTALNPQSLRVKANILKLIELQEANKLLIG